MLGCCALFMPRCLQLLVELVEALLHTRRFGGLLFGIRASAVPLAARVVGLLIELADVELRIRLLALWPAPARLLLLIARGRPS